MPTSCLIVGSNPNIAFYAWRFYKTDSLEDVTLVNPKLNKNLPITWRSTQLGSSQYKPHDIYSSLKQVPSNKKFDIVVIGCNSLQDFQGVCIGLKNLINQDSIILVELTGYVNLEPYVTANFAKTPVSVVSMMNESDVRAVAPNEYSHQLRNNDTRIYLGSTSGSSKIANNKNFQKAYKLLQAVQEQSHSSITLLKSLTPKEFMTYQWKLALPRVIFSPIMTLFEISVPEELSKHILSKPLITGLINELFKLIKKMDCKLVKGFENEANLLKYWCEVYPATKQNDNYLNSPQFLYNFYKHLDLELDLLLLQPILLSDDNGVRTPYLENIYSTMSQFQKINSPGGSKFFQRKGEDLLATTNGNSEQHKLLNNDIEEKIQKQKKLDAALKDIEISKISLENDVIKQEMNLKSIQMKISEAENRLGNLQRDYEKKSKSAQYEHDEKLRKLAYEHDQKYRSLDEEYKQKSRDLESSYKNNNNQESVADISPVSIPATNPSSRHDETPKNINNRDSVMTQSGLQDYKNFVQYGDAIGPDTPVIRQKQRASPTQPILQSSPKDNENVENFVDASTSQLKQPYEQNRRQPSQGQHQFPPYNGQQGNDFQGQPGYFDQQQQQQQQQYQKQYRNGPPQQPHYPGSGPSQPQLQSNHSHNYQQRPNYNPAYNTSFSNDQNPPHGLPNGGMSQTQFPPPLRSNGSMVGMNKYQGYPPMQQQQQQQQQQQHAPQMQRLNSLPGSVNTYQDNHSQYNTNPASFKNAAPIDPFIEQRFKANPKKGNRRSAMPMNGNLDGLDMGGRGGMPLPGTGRKSVSMIGGPSNGYPQHAGRRTSSSGPIMLNTTGGGPQAPAPAPAQASSAQPQQPPQQPQLYGTHLRPPSMNDSQTSSSSANSNDTPKTNNDNVNVNVPTIDSSNAKPLGGISSSNKGESNEKKKRGFFGKKKK